MIRMRKRMADGGPVLPGAEDFVKGFKGATHEYAEGGEISKRYEVSSGSDEHHESETEAERRMRPTQQDKQDDDGASGAMQSDRALEPIMQGKVNEYAADENREDYSNQGSRSKFPHKIQEYAYGGRVLDERPGDDQGPEDSDLQDREIERQNETADQNDRNYREKRDQGQHLSNASEDRQEEHKQPMHENERADRRDDEKEYFRMLRLRKAMGR
jgi:hypothetical protein